MAESYKTLHNLQQAAQENGAYYGPDEVWVEEGYYADESSTYHLVHKACVDRRGEPIRMQLHLAYGNTTNSKIEQGIFNASKVEFADKMLVAIPKSENGWYGKAIWHGAPIQSADEPTLYTVGFTRAGVMRVYNNGVSVDQMLRDTIENAMGCSGVLIQNGQVTDDSYRANIPNAGQQTSRVCIGQNLDTREVIILTVGNENDVNRKGLTSKACAEILLGQGCDIAVELCEGVGSAAMDKGSLMYVPDDEQQPNAYAFWFISRKCFYKTDYERELAELIQNYGACIWDGFLNKKNIESVKNDLDAEIARAVAAENALGERVTEEVTRAKDEEQRIEGKLDTEIQRAKDAEAELQESINDETLRAKAEEQRIDAKVDAEVKRATDAEDELGVRIDGEVSRAKAEEQRIDGKVDAEIARAKAAEAGLQSALDKEVHDRTNADSTLHQEILTEQGERTAADTMLQNNINSEASTRATEDGKLQASVDAEIQARTAEDAKIRSELGGKIEALTSRVTQCETDIHQLDSLTSQMQQQMSGLDKSVSDMLVTVSKLEVAMENVKQTVLNMNTVVAECNAKVEELNTNVEGMTSGQTVLPYVKKGGDTMTGPLVMADAAGAAKGSVATADGGVSMKAANGAFVKVDGSQVTIGDNAGNSVKLQGIYAATKDNEAVNYYQLKQKADSSDVSDISEVANAANTKATQASEAASAAATKATQASAAASAADTKAAQASAAASAADTKATKASEAASAADTKATQANTNASAAKTAADSAKAVADEAATEAAQASADVAEIVAGTKELPYVKKAGDTMTGALNIQGSVICTVSAVVGTIGVGGVQFGQSDQHPGAINWGSGTMVVTPDTNGTQTKPATLLLESDAEHGITVRSCDGSKTKDIQIHGLAAGTADTDAVNMAQLNDVNAKANAANAKADEAGSAASAANTKANDAAAEAARVSEVVAEIMGGTKALPYVKGKISATFGIPAYETALKCTNSSNQELAGAEARMGTGFAAKSVGGIATMLNFWTRVNVRTIPDDGIVRWTVPLTKPAQGFRLMVCNPLYYLHSGDTHTLIGTVNTSIDYNNNIFCEFHRLDDTKASASIVMEISALALVTE